jgi:hypothetical protein
MADLLWMTEDELRHECVLLAQALLQSESYRGELLQQMKKALRDGYTRGYTDAVVQHTVASSYGDEKSVSVH